MSEWREIGFQVRVIYELLISLIVRVGGGYLSIDEFLDIYTPMELDRVDRNDPVKKFSEKVAVQKALAFNSPARSPRDI